MGSMPLFEDITAEKGATIHTLFNKESWTEAKIKVFCFGVLIVFFRALVSLDLWSTESLHFLGMLGCEACFRQTIRALTLLAPNFHCN